MRDFLLALAFAAMVLSPALVASIHTGKLDN
jgi:NADH:ubiquinone oxidoreductase subunit 6 (subunit J)